MIRGIALIGGGLHPSRWTLQTSINLVFCSLAILTSSQLHADSADGIQLKMERSLEANLQALVANDAVSPQLSLAKLGELALLAQPAILAADARVRADSERLEQARGNLRPTVGGTLGYRREFADSGATLPFTNLSGGVLVSVPIYRPQADAGIGQAQFQESVSRSAVAEARQEVLFRTVDAFLTAAQADEEASILIEEREILLGQRRLNQRRMEGGVGTRVELMETSARTETILAQIESVKNVYQAQLAELRRLSAARIDGVARLRDSLPPLVVPEIIDLAIAQAREKNAGLSRLDAALSAAKAGVEVQRAALLPTVSLVGNLDRSRFSASGSTSFLPSTSLGIQLAFPFSTGGIAESRIRETLALADVAQAQYDDAARIIETELRKAYLDLQRTIEQWRIQRGVFATANESLEATRKAFDAGARTNIDLLNSQQLTFATRRELLRARVGTLAAQIRIMTIIGLLNVETLQRLQSAFAQIDDSRASSGGAMS
ncbi:MAG: TolC family protein, partial [Burkholderiales bacterium]